MSLLDFRGARKKKRYLLTRKESKENQVESNDHLQEQLSLAPSLTHSLTHSHPEKTCKACLFVVYIINHDYIIIHWHDIWFNHISPFHDSKLDQV